jgi:GTP-binding protein Era
MRAAAALGDFHALHPVSAKTGDGIAELRAELISLLPEGPRYYAEGEVTDMPLEARIAELVRERALALTRDELPHAISVEVNEIEDGRVHALVYVETESQKGIVVGKGGRMIREIGSQARPEIERLLGRRVFLELKVKVKAKWRRDETLLERLGI